MKRRLAVLVAVALTLAPVAAQACAVCAAANERNRLAFFWTTIFLSLLPLGMVGAGGLWLRNQKRAGGAQGPHGEGDGSD